MEDSDIRIRDLRGYTLIGFQRAASPKLYDDLQAALSLMKFSPNYISDPVNETEILALVSAGAGLAFANASQIWRKPQGVLFAPVADLDVTMSLQIVHRPEDCSPALMEFLKIISNQL
nr:LysR substrate-binding domain-containing protein [uncultured Celeribacter sp.]